MPRTIDGVIRRPLPPPLQRTAPVQSFAPQQPQVTAPPPTQKAPAPAAPAIRRPMYGKPVAKPQKRRGVPERLQLPLIILGAMVAGIFAQSLIFGELLIAGYGVGALVWRVASRTTFTLALLSLVATTIVLIFRGNVALAQNFATYTFLLLVVGVITLIRELKKEGGRVYSNRKNY